MTIVCGDSHTSTHGAFGALAQGIGTSEVEHVLATQTLRQLKSKNMRVSFVGAPAAGRRRQGLRAGADRPDRHGRRHRPRDRIRRRGGAGALDGRADDALQHDHRGRRARRPGGAGRDHLRLPDGPAGRAEGRRLGDGARLLEELRQRSGRRTSTARSTIDVAQARPDGHLGHQPRGRGRHRRRRPRSGRLRRGAGGAGAPDARLHGPRARPADPGRADRPGLHRLVHQQPHRGPARRRRHRAKATEAGRRVADARARPWSCRARAW